MFRLSTSSVTTGVPALFLQACLLVFCVSVVQGEDLFFDDFENGLNGWTIYRESFGAPLFCTTDEWHMDTNDSHSATTSWSNSPYLDAGGDDPSSVCFNNLQSPIIPLPVDVSNVQIVFWHHFNTEDTFDGGVLEVSTDGTTWSSISPFYDGLSQPGNGLQYNQEVLNLGESFYTPGDDLRIRFRFSSDQLAGGVGWFVDDVLVRGDRNIAVERTNFSQVKILYQTAD